MAEYSGFFDGDDLYGQDEFNRYFDNIYKSGISIDDNGNMTFTCIINGDSLIIKKGFAILKGFYYYLDSDKTMQIDRDINYTRIDRIVIKLDLSTKKVTLERKKGIGSSSPVIPQLQRDNLVYEISLCKITVPKTGLITITDERFDTNLCGAIRPKNLSEIETMISTYQKNWNDWFSQQQNQGWRRMYIQTETPADSVAGAIWIKLI
ncbi:MAG: hypothetical protein ACRCXT_24065 [Paraclostridium sp.]